ncbi:MAG TPA: hypothetical protein DEG09_04140 [Marinilabiliaceae bacterium]|nr:hypothetical protein [Marinilabiliaceae bacterium]HBX87790.1 hypothetical protein [Marinilabiliaceae bacterium]
MFGNKTAHNNSCLLFRTAAKIICIMPKRNRIKVREVSREEYDLNFSKYHYSLFLVSEFIDSLADGKRIYYLNFERGGEVVAKLSGLGVNKKGVVGTYLYCYAGPAIIEYSEELYNLCLEALRRWARKNRLSRVDICYYDQQHQWRCQAKGYYSRANREFVRYFDPEEESPSFTKSVRYNARKAARLNPVFGEETSERMLQKLHEMLKATHEVRNERHNGNYKAYPYESMTKEGVDRLFNSGYMKLYYLEVDGVIHCVRLAIERDKRIYGLMIGGDEFAYKNGLAHYLQYQLINKLHKEGYKYYNISVVNFGEDGLVAYKESLGCMRHKVHGAYTHFLTFPRYLLNPVMNTGRFVAGNKHLKKLIAFGYKKITGVEADI